MLFKDLKSICGEYEYKFWCGPSQYKVKLTIHDIDDKELASVATISWKGDRTSWRAFKEANSKRLFGYNNEEKTWKIRCCEFLYYTITEGNLGEDGLTSLK